MRFSVRVLTSNDARTLDHVAPDVFDDPIIPASAQKFLDDPNSVLIVAIDEAESNLVVGFASALVYGHPDKARPEMFINEVGVTPSCQKQGVGKSIMKVLLVEAEKRDCRCAWVPADDDNGAAKALYLSAGGEAPEKQIHIDFDLTGR